MNDRSSLLNRWLQQLGYRDYLLAPASEDASFRSYLRLQVDGKSFVVMDAPPEQEPCDRFIAVAGMLRTAGLNAPEIIDSNLQDGFLLLTDFGAEDYLSRLDERTQGPLYRDALAALLTMQTGIDADALPRYDEALLRREMGLFHDWFLGELLGIELDASQQQAWEQIQQALIANFFAQPQVFVHRDYHSRNLMLLPQANPGILDFQDAVRGPICYDLVSLLRDCYIAWPAARVEQLMLDYHAMAVKKSLLDVDAGQFKNWFDLTGIQRHLKAVGIFSRLKIRDGKSRYLGDVPRTLAYIDQVSSQQRSMSGLAELLEQLQLGSRLQSLQGD
jgi:N-acetylmuramate 1-kinase